MKEEDEEAYCKSNEPSGDVFIEVETQSDDEECFVSISLSHVRSRAKPPHTLGLGRQHAGSLISVERSVNLYPNLINGFLIYIYYTSYLQYSYVL